MAAKLTCSPDDIKVISPQEARALLDSDAKGDYILLDVRQPDCRFRIWPNYPCRS